MLQHEQNLLLLLECFIRIFRMQAFDLFNFKHAVKHNYSECSSIFYHLTLYHVYISIYADCSIRVF